MKRHAPEREDLTAIEAMLLRERLSKNELTEADRRRLSGVLDFTLWLQNEAEHNRLTKKKLMELLFGKAKKPDDDDKDDSDDSGKSCGSDAETSGNDKSEKVKKKKKKHGKNHGRTPASAYKNAIQKDVPHESYKVGDACPTGCGGKLYALTPGLILQVRGQADAYAVQYNLERLRCKLCGELFTATAPEGVSKQNKYDAQFKANVALNKYMTGTAFHAMETRYGAEEMPISDSTIWKCVSEVDRDTRPVFHAMQSFVAQADLFFYDDTWCKILSVAAAAKKDPEQKKGCYTTVVLSEREEKPVCLYFSGNEHAGTNMESLLSKREKNRSVAMTMSDALSANFKGDFQTLVCKCLAHATRKFKDVEGIHVDFAEDILKAFGKIYENEREVIAQKLTPEKRLDYHKQHSKPILDALHEQLTARSKNKAYEPNSHFGKAAAYLLKHWDEMTQFVKVIGAPIDNNVCERAVKQAIRIRKTGYFHRTENGAKVASCVMSLIKTCRLNKVNPLKFLVACQKYAKAVAAEPHLWFPWNFHLQVARLEAAA